MGDAGVPDGNGHYVTLRCTCSKDGGTYCHNVYSQRTEMKTKHRKMKNTSALVFLFTLLLQGGDTEQS